ncbi:MAG: aminodeoxychorismate/anthranilate synthase component II [Salibacteraceae bacterium]
MTTRPRRILLIDNYDSFSYNLVHLLEQLDLPVSVVRNDEIDFDILNQFSHIIISPGPGIPKDAGKLMKLIDKCRNTHCILGVCLGMQALLEHAGAEMHNLPIVEHGALTIIEIVKSKRMFLGMPSQISVGRYHSWAFKEDQVPSEFSITALADDGIVMSVEHKSLPLFGVQFHPESIMTSHGLAMLRNWVNSDNLK